MSFDIMNIKVEEPKRNFDDYEYTIYGVPGIGKTTLCAELFKDPAFWCFDNNHEHIRGKKVPTPDWRAVKKHVGQLKRAYDKGLPMPFKTAVWDTIDVASKLCQDYVCRSNGWSHPNDPGYGQGWDAIRLEWGMTIKTLKECGIKVVFIAHDNMKEFERRDGTKYNQIVPNSSKTFLGEVIDGVNFVFFADKEYDIDEDGNITGEKRVLHCRQTSEFVAKAHFGNFPEKIYFEETPAKTAKKIRDIFDKAVIEEFGDGEKEVVVSTTSDTKKTTKQPPTKNHTKESVIEENTNETTEEHSIEAKTNTDSESENIDSKDSGATDTSLSDLKKELGDLFMSIYKSGEKSPAELVSIIRKNANVDKISEIDNTKDALKVKEALSM